jgi:hypothetical protein
MSLNLLIEFGDAFDFTGTDFAGWCRSVGSRAARSCRWPGRPALASPTSSTGRRRTEHGPFAKASSDRVP